MQKIDSDGIPILSMVGGGGGGLTNFTGYAQSNTTQATSGTIPLSSVNFVGAGLASVGITNGSVVISVPAGAPSPVNFSAGTTSNNLGSVVFSNSNGVSFGLNGSTITGSIATSLTNINVSAGTTSNNLSAFTLSNSNNVSFGLNASVITATATVASTQGSINISAGTTSNLSASFTFSNSNGLAFGLNAGTITGSYTVPTVPAQFSGGNSNLGNTAGDTGVVTGRLVLVGTNNITLSGSTNGGSMTISISGGAGGGGGSLNVSAGTTSNNLTNLVFSNSNNVSFGLNGSTITATVTVASSLTNIRVSAGTTSNLLSALTFDNVAGPGGVSFGLNGSVITAEISPTANVVFVAGTTDVITNEIYFVDSNNLSFGLNGNSITASAPWRVSAGTTSEHITQLDFLDGNGISFGYNSVGNGLSASHNGLTSQSNQNAVASNGNFNFQTISFSNANGFSFGTSAGSAIFGSYTVPTQTNQTLGIYASSQTTGQSSSSTYDARSLSLVGDGIISIGWSNSSLRISATQSNQAFSAAGGSSAFQTLGFSDNSNVSFTNTNGSVAIVSVKASLFAVSNTTQSSSGTQNLNALSFGGAGIASVGITNGSVVISVPSGGGAGDGGVFAGVSNLGATAGSTGTVSTGNFVLVGSNGISLSQSTGAAGSNATVTILPPPETIYTYYPQNIDIGAGNIGWATNTSNAMSLFPFSVGKHVAVEFVNLFVSVSFITGGTSSFRQSGTLHWGLFTRPTDSNHTRLSGTNTGSFSYGVTYSNSTITIVQPTSSNSTGYGTGSTTSAGLNLTSGYTGIKNIGLYIGTTLSPGFYWLGMYNRMSSSSFNSGLRFSLAGPINNQLSAMAPLGSFSSAYTSGANLTNQLGQIVAFRGSYSVAALTQLTTDITISQISANIVTAPLFILQSRLSA